MAWLHGLGAAVGGLRVEIDGVARVGQSADRDRWSRAGRRIPCEMASSLAALRPTSSGRGMMVSLSLSLMPPCCDDGVDGAAQVLVQPHASGDAVHDDAD